MEEQGEGRGARGEKNRGEVPFLNRMNSSYSCPDNCERTQSSCDRWLRVGPDDTLAVDLTMTSLKNDYFLVT
jgi:hypothetical protein